MRLVSPSESGLSFRGLRAREDTRYIVLHWTAGVGLARQVFATLARKRLSVHFVVEPDGTVYQFAETDRLCQHAGKIDDGDGDGHQASGNRYSIGIEIVNPANTMVLARGVERQAIREVIHGQERIYSSFTSAQVVAVLELVEHLCGEWRLPMVVPMLGSDVLSTVMGEAAFADFRGVLGHLHLTMSKSDPGLAVLRAVHARRAALAYARA